MYNVAQATNCAIAIGVAVEPVCRILEIHGPGCINTQNPIERQRPLSDPKSVSGQTDNPDLAPVEQQAAGFEAVREARRSETAEDYVELIDDLIKATGEARVVDVAARMGVSHATVNRILSRLTKEGLVNTQPYRSIFLTDAGTNLAQESRERHRIVVEFLTALGIDEGTAERDAEGIEHYVSEATIQAFQDWTGKIRS